MIRRGSADKPDEAPALKEAVKSTLKDSIKAAEEEIRKRGRDPKVRAFSKALTRRVYTRIAKVHSTTTTAILRSMKAHNRRSIIAKKRGIEAGTKAWHAFFRGKKAKMKKVPAKREREPKSEGK